jgi:hypothetical protein
MVRETLHPTDLLACAEDAVRALQYFIGEVMPCDLPTHGIALDTADECVSEVEVFVKAYRKKYGSPVR